jgi:hypothetical protein
MGGRAGGGSGTSGGASGRGGSTGNSGGGAAPARPDGQVVAPWDKLCVATFTRDFEVIDAFGDPELSVQSGDRYLQGDGGLFAEAVIVYVSDEGPVEFDIDVENGEMLPFTSNCQDGSTKTYAAVFADTPVYSDEAMTMQLCSLRAGTMVEGSGIGYIAAGGGFTMPKYQLMLEELAAQCGGAQEGYAAGAEITIGETSHIVVPIGTVLGPR